MSAATGPKEAVYALVLAAGRSTRMGPKPKLLLPYGTSTVLGCVLDAVASAPIDRAFVVLGAWREEIEPVVRPYPVSIVYNPDFDRGMLSSVQAGFRALPSGDGAVFVVPGDHPAVPAAVFARLLAARGESGAGMVVPQCGGRGGHPLLVDLRFRAEIEGLDPAVGLRGLLDLHPESVLRVPLEEEGVVLDLDTPADYQAAQPKNGKKISSGNV
jgi:molybdenum cofactor cytidylyltransferase